MRKHVRIDFSYAKNALFVRQTVAVAFGIPLDQEFTWGVLSDLICGRESIDLPEQMTVEGLSSLSVQVPGEAINFKAFLKHLGSAHPDIDIRIRIH